MPFLKVLRSCPQGVLHKLPLLLITFFPRLFICTTCSFSSWRCQLMSPPQRRLPWLLIEKNFHLLFFTTVNCYFVFIFFKYNIDISTWMPHRQLKLIISKTDLSTVPLWPAPILQFRLNIFHPFGCLEFKGDTCGGGGEDSWEALGLQGDPASPSSRGSVLNIHWKDWCWSRNSNTLATWCEELTHWKRPWCWERLKAGGEGDDRGWDGWMASPTQWTWV